MVISIGEAAVVAHRATVVAHHVRRRPAVSASRGEQRRAVLRRGEEWRDVPGDDLRAGGEGADIGPLHRRSQIGLGPMSQFSRLIVLDAEGVRISENRMLWVMSW